MPQAGDGLAHTGCSAGDARHADAHLDVVDLIRDPGTTEQ